MARSILSHVCSNRGNEIHVLFDTYVPSSLKESERRLRGADDRPFVISGPEQAPKQSCQKLLQNGIFKDQLAKCLLKEWQEDHYGPILDKKTLVVSHGGNCSRFIFSDLNSKMNVENPGHLQGKHEEADTLLAFHASNVDGNVMVRASDTDVLVILLGMIGRRMKSNMSSNWIIMDCGSGNNRRYIDVSCIAAALEAKQDGLAAAMPGLHAFTGCNYTAAFYRKVKPLEILEKDAEGTFIEFFDSMTSREEPNQMKAEEFVCSLYGVKDVKDVNEARYAKLLLMTGKINQENPLASVKKIDCTLLPPCARTLCNKTKRAHFVSIVWGHADSSHPDQGLDPLNYGWKDKNGCYVPDWFSGPAVPDYLFLKGNVSERAVDLGNDQPDLAAEFDDVHDASSELPWSDDSESETEM
ncbi:uncharacterized protein LOC121378189 [Gigantopelta aegis]|uniref:uncharacterized protein LOC121378189 n=1 Tax=Gigantopelta aegis TaxID=1735272 RepID=UPI001B88E712|nr:uncharacterized protein LOC121378189 [Gigantopelta aegis]